MNVLVACEFSGTVRDAFTRAGHYAVSCDLEAPMTAGPHVQGDVLDELDDGKWDLMIAHPPCTYLSYAGVQYMTRPERQQPIKEALDFVRKLMNAPIPRICVENPRSLIGKRIRRHDQSIHPWQFGHPEYKETWLWLKNLPRLRPTKIIPFKDRIHEVMENTHGGGGISRQQQRSIFWRGIADAMADQWTNPVTLSSFV